MQKQLPFLFIILFGIQGFSQISFEKGYYINNSDQKIECEIKNIDWKNNPTEFEYRQSENGMLQVESIKSVKEFGIYNTSKYIRKIIYMDRSSGNINNLTIEKKPILNEEEIFLKVLVEGKTNLYKYVDGSLIRYFFSPVDNPNIEQLIYKRYKTSSGDIGKNNKFRQQLWDNLKCSTITMSQVESLEYNDKSLITFFSKYYTCNHLDFVIYETPKKDLVNISLRPRINYSSLMIENPLYIYSSRDTDFGNKLGVGFGIEVEYVLPYNKSKWAVLIEPTYQNYKEEKIKEEGISPRKVEVNYNYFELPLSLRHYFFLNDNSKLFVNASYVFVLSTNSLIEFKRNDNSIIDTLDIDQFKNHFAFGMGYKLNDKYSLEIRYHTSIEILSVYATTYWKSEYNNISLIFGYSLF